MAVDGTDVVPESLSEFGDEAIREGARFSAESFGTMGQIGHGAKAGMSGIPEGQGFSIAYQTNMERLKMFLGDAGTGIWALGTAARAIALNYQVADMSQAEQMSLVGETFDAAGTPLSSYREQAKPEKSAESVPEPAGFQPPGPADPCVVPGERVMGPHPPTPEGILAWHNERYEAYEHWRPEPAAGVDSLGASTINAGDEVQTYGTYGAANT